MRVIKVKLFIIASAILLWNIHAFGQTIRFRSVKSNSTIETEGKVLFGNDKIVLENVTIKCQEMEISNKVNYLKISGSVKFICDKMSLKKKDAPIILTSNGGNLTIEYSTFNDQGRTFFIKKVDGIKLIFKKK